MKRVRRAVRAAAGAPPQRGARRRNGCGGRRYAPTSLRCSTRGRAAKLTARASLAPFEQSPRVRWTKRAARADPESALLGAAEVAPPSAPLRRRAGSGPRRRAERPAPTPRAPGRLPLEQPSHRAQSRCALREQTPLPAKARAVGRGRACAQPRSAATPARARSARRPSDSRRLSERSERSSRSELRRVSRRCEHRREPPRSGGCAPKRPGPTARAFVRALASSA